MIMIIFLNLQYVRTQSLPMFESVEWNAHYESVAVARHVGHWCKYGIYEYMT